MLRPTQTLEIEYTRYDSLGRPVRVTIKEDGRVTSLEGRPEQVSRLVEEARDRHLASFPS